MSWINYLLEANLYLVLFYASYYLLLRRETYYQLNRAYLLTSSALAFIIPLFQLGILKPIPLAIQNNVPGNIGYSLPAITINNVTLTNTAPPAAPTNYCLLVYVLIACVMALSLLFRIVQLVRLARKGKRQSKNKFHLIEMADNDNAFSFFGYLFIGKKLRASDTVIQHELVHIRQRHSLDIIYIELLKIISWFNPVVYLLQSSIRELHEYIADNQIAAAQQDVHRYTDFLISNAYGLPQTALTNNFFNKNLLKKRIMMLHQKRSGGLARLKLLVALPLLGGMLCLSTLAFTKDYHVFDIAPHVVKSTVTKHQQTTKAKNKVLLINHRNGATITTQQLGMVVAGTKKVYTPETITEADKKELAKKGMDVSVVTDDELVAKKNKLLFSINPSNYTYKGIAKIAEILKANGYSLSYTEENLGTDSVLLGFTVNAIPSSGKEGGGGSAIFRVKEMRQIGRVIVLGYDEDINHVVVHSMPKANAPAVPSPAPPVKAQTPKKVPPPPPAPPVKTQTPKSVPPPPPAPPVQIQTPKGVPPPPPPMEPVKTTFIGLANYMGNAVKYTKTALDNKLTAAVAASFKLDEAGRIGDIKIAQGAGAGLDEAVIKALLSYKKKIDDKPGNYTIGVDFIILEKQTMPAINNKVKTNNYIGTVPITNRADNVKKSGVIPPRIVPVKPANGKAMVPGQSE